MLYFDVYPFALFETNGSKDVSGYLVGEDAHPDANDAPVEEIAAYVGKYGSDDRYAKCGYFCSKFRVAGATKASHVDNLGYLEEDGYDDYIGNMNTNFYDMRLGREEEPKEPFSCKQVNNSE